MNGKGREGMGRAGRKGGMGSDGIWGVGRQLGSVLFESGG